MGIKLGLFARDSKKEIGIVFCECLVSIYPSLTPRKRRRIALSRPPYALRSPVVWMSVFPLKSLQCCRIVAPFAMVLPFYSGLSLWTDGFMIRVAPWVQCFRASKHLTIPTPCTPPVSSPGMKPHLEAYVCHFGTRFQLYFHGSTVRRDPLSAIKWHVC